MVCVGFEEGKKLARGNNHRDTRKCVLFRARHDCCKRDGRGDLGQSVSNKVNLG